MSYVCVVGHVTARSAAAAAAVAAVESASLYGRTDTLSG